MKDFPPLSGWPQQTRFVKERGKRSHNEDSVIKGVKKKKPGSKKNLPRIGGWGE